MKKLLLLFAVLLTAFTASAENYILYTSTNGEVVNPAGSFYGLYGEYVEILSNRYENGQGKILFSRELGRIGTNAFFGRSTLKTITIPESVTSIGENAFWMCSNLTTITIPESVTSIGTDAFSDCSSLQEVVSLNTTPPTCKYGSFDYAIFSTATLKVPAASMNAYLSADEWRYFQKIEAIYDEGEEVQETPYFILYTSTRGQVIEPNASADFGANIVSNTYRDGQGKIFFDGEVTAIGDKAFSMSALKSITIPESVTSIGTDAFFMCSLESITIPESVTSIGDWAFSQTGISSVTLPESVISIGKSVFSGCRNLESVYSKFSSDDNRCLIIDGVLNSFAPAGLSSYSYVVPSSVTAIGHGAFILCSIESLTIPASVTAIDEVAFNCWGLEELTSLPTTPPSVTTNSFFNSSFNLYEKCVLRVPAESLIAYKTADGWKKFQNIVALTEEELKALPVEGLKVDGRGEVPVWNLSGQRVGQGYRGIVIRGGKKQAVR